MSQLMDDNRSKSGTGALSHWAISGGPDAGKPTLAVLALCVGLAVGFLLRSFMGS